MSETSGFEEVADEARETGPSDEDLASVSTYAQQQIELEDAIALATSQLQELNRQLVQVSQFQLPEAMQRAGCESYTLTNGAAINVKPFVRGHITEVNKPAAYGWLDANGHAAIIKNEIKTNFGRGEKESAELLATFLQEHGWDFDQKSSIHANTLNAFLREEIENGSTIPHDIFGIFVGAKAKIVRPV